ncbi:MAG: cyclic nucleotide-binding domain-containing protein, partial [Gammaproteobacteria bacterium]|nr:cyclic nucleotide-binding domain-containing protein [Gammaproteobacteria bacterium]
RFGTAARRFADEKRAALETLRDVLRPVTLTTIALCGGFLVMASSELRNQVQFGMLAAFTLACAWVIDVTVTPALTAGARIATFWDVLRLDLGSEPHKEIAVFEGLTARQTRVFAMMMDIRSIRAGDLLMRQGETGVRDIYVVLEGELSVYSERDGSETPIRTARRGDLVGTMGHYSGTRNATVRAKEAAR